MSKSIHFFDLDGTLWKLYGKAWLVNKADTSKPLHILNFNEYNDIVLGINRIDDIDIEYNGEKYWISKSLFDKMKKKVKNLSKDMLGLSFIEMKNPDYFNKISFYMDNIKHLSGKNDIEIGILSARHSEKNDQMLLSALNDQLSKLNLEVKKFYYLFDNYQNMVNNTVNFRKMNVLLEHMVGFKIKNDHFTTLKQDLYDEVYFYDDEFTNINTCSNIQTYFEEYLRNSDDDVYHRIMNLLEKRPVLLHTYLITNNRLNRFKINTILLKKPITYPTIKESADVLSFSEFKEKY